MGEREVFRYSLTGSCSAQPETLESCLRLKSWSLAGMGCGSKMAVSRSRGRRGARRRGLYLNMLSASLLASRSPDGQSMYLSAIDTCIIMSCSRTSRRTAQTEVHKRAIIHRQSAFLLDVPLPECLRKMFDRYARHQEAIECHATRSRIVLGFGRCIPLLQLAHEIAREGVSKAIKRLFQFSAVDRARTVTVELLEDIVPVLQGSRIKYNEHIRSSVGTYFDVSIQSLEFDVIDRSTAIRVKDVCTMAFSFGKKCTVGILSLIS